MAIDNKDQQEKLLAEMPGVEERARAAMVEAVDAKEKVPFKDIVRKEVEALNGGISPEAKQQLSATLYVSSVART